MDSINPHQTPALLYAMMAGLAYDHHAAPPVGWTRIQMGSSLMDSNPEDWGGFYASAFKKGSHVVVAYRGTDDRHDLIADVGIGINGKAFWEQYDYAKAYFKIVRDLGSSCSVTGHSLGGALASMIGAAMNVPAVSFNAPGVRSIYAKGGDKHIGCDIVHFRATTDLVSRWDDGIGREVFLDVDSPIDTSKARNPKSDITQRAIETAKSYGDWHLHQHSISRMINAINLHHKCMQSPWHW